MQTPRSPSLVGRRCRASRSAARRSTLKVPIRLTRITVSNSSKLCGPLLPAIFSAGPMPAQQTEIRSPSSPGGVGDGGGDLLGVGDVGGDEARAELVGQLLRRARG